MEALRQAAARALDWRKVVRASAEHRLSPLVFSAMRSGEATVVPAAALAALCQQARSDAQTTLRQIVETGRIVRAFAAAKLPVMVLKGAALSLQLFGSSSLRRSRDIDLLVAPEDSSRADLILREHGYRPPYELSPGDWATADRVIKDREYCHAISGICVELHTRLTDNPLMLPWDFKSLWCERDKVRLGDVEISTLARHRLPLYLCVHGASHGWERLHWLADLAALLRGTSGTAAAIAEAEVEGLGAAMLQAVMLAHRWFGLEATEFDLRHATDSAQVGRLEFLLRHSFGGTLFSAPPDTAWQRFKRYSFWQRLYRLTLRSNRRYWAREFAGVWISVADRQAVRLPAWLAPLYLIVRPFGWLVRRWKTESLS